MFLRQVILISTITLYSPINASHCSRRLTQLAVHYCDWVAHTCRSYLEADESYAVYRWQSRKYAGSKSTV